MDCVFSAIIKDGLGANKIIGTKWKQFGILFIPNTTLYKSVLHKKSGLR